MRRGEVWWANLPSPWGRRPVVLLARDEAYSLLTWVMVAPLTTRLRHNPTHVLLDPEADGVPTPSVVNLDAIQSIHLEWLESWITQLSTKQIQAIDGSIHFALSLRNCV